MLMIIYVLTAIAFVSFISSLLIHRYGRQILAHSVFKLTLRLALITLATVIADTIILYIKSFN